MAAVYWGASHAPVRATSLYWTDENSIRRMDLDGANPELLVSGLQRIEQLAVDLLGGKMYWAQRAPFFLDSTISRANLDGTAVEQLLEGIYTDGGVAVDRRRNKLYWGGTVREPERYGIYSTQLNDWRTEFFFAPQRLDVTLLYLNSGGERIHMLDTDDAVLFQHRIDGTLLPPPASAETFAFGPSEDSIYWTDRNNLMTAMPDGTSIALIGSYPVDFFQAIAIHPLGGKLFFAEGASIYTSSLDGSSIQELYRGTCSVLDLVIVPEPATASLCTVGLLIGLVPAIRALWRRRAH